MKHDILVVTLTLGITLFSSITMSDEIVIVDPDEFENGTDISHTFDGVSLSSIGGNSVGAVFSRTDGQATSGTQTFGNNATNGIIPNLVWFEGSGFDDIHPDGGAVLRIDFDTLTDFVAIDISNQDSFDGAILRAFDSNGVELGSETSSVSGAFVELSIAVSSATISYVTVAGNSAQDSVHLDKLQFNKIIATDPNFDSATGIVTFPRVTVDGKEAFLNVELLLNSDGSYRLLKAEPE